MMWMYVVVFFSLLAIECIYFEVAKRFGIVDEPDERSSHASVVLRGGGIIFPLSVVLWAFLECVMGASDMVTGYWPFFTGLLLLAVTGFVDDVRSMSVSVRLIAQFLAAGLMLGQLAQECGAITAFSWYGIAAVSIVAMTVLVGAVNVVNFMDGINGITAGYSLAVLMPLLVLNSRQGLPFVPNSFLWVSALASIVIGIFNFRPNGKAKCFIGDVGSLSIGFIMLFALCRLIVQTGDVTWAVLLAVYGVDGVMTILHRVMLHENIGVAHRKHAYQLMANELGISHVWVSALYMALQLVISLVAIYVVPDSAVAHWTYVAGVVLVLVLAYVVFMKKHYHLHEEYLLKQGQDNPDIN